MKKEKKKTCLFMFILKKIISPGGVGGRVVLKDIHPGLTFLIFFLRDYNRNDK